MALLKTNILQEFKMIGYEWYRRIRFLSATVKIWCSSPDTDIKGRGGFREMIKFVLGGINLVIHVRHLGR